MNRRTSRNKFSSALGIIITFAILTSLVVLIILNSKETSDVDLNSIRHDERITTAKTTTKTESSSDTGKQAWVEENTETTEPKSETETETVDTTNITEINYITVEKTEPPTENFTEHPKPSSETPKDDFMQAMFDNAIEIPESQNKIEPPPESRDVELQYGAVPLSDAVPEPFEYFKNIIFLGDSMTTGFDLYRSKITFNGDAVLRDATVVAAINFSVYNALKDVSANSVHPLYQGKKTLPEDIIAQKDAKYVLICLGLNDVNWQQIDFFVNNYSTLINRIKEKSPEKIVVIMSITPIVYASQKTNLNNAIIMEANNALLRFAIENNIPFIDYAAALRDSQNNLFGELSSDGYCHFTLTAYNRLVEYLLYHPLKN